MSQTADIVETVVSQAKRLEDYDDPEQFDVLEVKVLASLDGRAREVIAVTGIGGPTIEVNLTKGTVEGWWGGDHHVTHFQNDDLAQILEDRYLASWVATETQR